MSSSTKFTLLFAVSLILISNALSKSLYEDVCKEVDDHNGCLKLLGRNPQIPLAKDYVTLCKVILQMAIDQATKAQNQIQELTKKYPSSKAIIQCATVDYTQSVEDFKSALRSIVEDPKSEAVNYEALVAGDGPKSCGNAIAAEKMVDNVISSLNDDIIFISFVAYTAATHL